MARDLRRPRPMIQRPVQRCPDHDPRWRDQRLPV